MKDIGTLCISFLTLPIIVNEYIYYYKYIIVELKLSWPFRIKRLRCMRSSAYIWVYNEA